MRRRRLPADGDLATLARLIRWTSVSGAQGVLRSGSSSTGHRLWTTSSGRRLEESSGPLVTAGWHTLVRVWHEQQVRQCSRGSTGGE